MPILAGGRLHLVLLGSAFAGDRKESMATLVQKLRKAINTRFRQATPDTAFVGRGGGFYDGTGRITTEFQAALETHGLKAFHGADASLQPGQSGDRWLHETAVAWTRNRLKRTLPKDPWQEAEAAFGKRLKLAQDYAHTHYDVASLCLAMPGRMRTLVHVKKGGCFAKGLASGSS